tara:strand:- start:8218 stop:8613 length:396 start_codon:yes stop_codon:yes gene_type:complete
MYPKDLGLMDFIDNNVWIPVHTLPGFEACIEYYVNAKGDVKSTKGEIERILKPKKKSSGYLFVNLTQRIGRNSIKTVPIHSLVAFAFLGRPSTPYGRTKGCSRVRHINKDRTDNRASNLIWIKLSDSKGLK